MSKREAEEEMLPSSDEGHGEVARPDHAEIEQIRAAFQSRLVAASLRTEAIRAGMIDLDGLKLLDLSALTLDENDSVIDGADLMRSLKQKKPWLFRTSSSSSSSAAPTSRAVRPKNAMEMTDEEYRSARSALLKR